MISVVVVTFNRLKLLKLCVNQVLYKTSDKTKEIIVWNNASTDGTREFLSTIKDPRFKIVNHTKNIGVNARARAHAMAKHDYFISLDDDVIEAPENWDKTLLDALKKMPEVGFLASNIIDDGHGTHAEYMYRQLNLSGVETTMINGVEVLPGWGGCWCAITPRQLYNQAGGFQESAKFIFWNEDSAYGHELKKMGYGKCLLKNLKVFHAAGPYYLNDRHIQKAKGKFYTYLHRRQKIYRIKRKIKKFVDKYLLAAQ